MEQKRDLAIILRSVEYGERSRIVTALTQAHGRISAVAKNSVHSRRFGGALEVFAASEWRFTEKPNAEMVHIEEAVIRRPYEGLRRSFERMALAGVFTELMLRLAPEREPCEELFRLHSNALAILEETEGDTVDLALLNAYMAKLLQWNGSQPQLQCCLGCEKTIDGIELHSEALSCVVQDAGWICPECRSQSTAHIRTHGSFANSMIRISPAALLDFHASLRLPIRNALESVQASQQEHRQLFRFLEAIFVYHLPGFDRAALKSLRFLNLESQFQ